MEMRRKRASDPNRGEYEIELPVVSIVRKSLLALDYSQGPIRIQDAAEMLAEKFSLTDKQKNARHRNGFNIYKHHVANAAGTLVKNGQLVRPKRGWIVKPKQENGSGTDPTRGSGNEGDTSEKSIEEKYQEIRKKLAAELLQKIKHNTPTFFEKLVVDLLVAMGYGGSWEDAGEVTGGPGDGGIDGIINQDKLGLDVVGVQAKLRTTGNNVSPSVINEFIGALRVKGLSKGVIITTASFSSNAKTSAERSDNPKIVLIDGEQLADYMIEHNVGVSTTKTYEIKRVDSDYFTENAGKP